MSKRIIGTLFFYFLISFPLIIWFFMLPLNYRFNSSTAIFRSLGQIAGLLGFSFFSASLILSSRLKFLEKYLSSLNKIYLNHHLFGGISFILLLFHPLLLSLVYLSNYFYLGALFFLPSLNKINVFWGELSLFLMIILLFITFFKRPAYEIWKFTHKFLGLAFFFASLHSLTIFSDVSQNPLLRGYIIILIVLSLILYFYHTVFGKIFIPKTKYQLKSLTKLNNEVFELILTPLNQPLNYLPGQFIFLKILKKGFSHEEHPFSLASSPAENFLRIIIKNLGNYTAKISLLPVGCIFLVEGPYGDFSYQKSPYKNQIWIAGGIGITPFIGMIKGLEQKKENYQIDLYYCTRDKEEFIFYHYLKDLSQKQKNLHLYFHCSRDHGRINAFFIKENSQGLENKSIFICGPKPMMSSLKNQFQALGVSKNDIITEEFEF